MKMRIAIGMIGVAALLAGCGESEGKTVNAKEPKVITRWKHDPQFTIGTPKGIILEQTGDRVEGSFVYLKEGEGFVVERKISQGKYYPAKGLIVFPPGMVIPEQIDELVRMDVPRVEVAFTPNANSEVLKARWVGQGSPEFELAFLRVRDKGETNAVPIRK